MRLLADRNVPLSVLSFDGRPTTEVLPAGSDHAYDLIAQVRAQIDPQRRYEVVRFLLAAKIGHEPPRHLDSIDDLRLYEGREAEKEWSRLGIVRERPHARDIHNAALNLGFYVLESIVRTAIRRKGLSPIVGFLHVPREGKDSFVYDVMEPFRGRATDAILKVRLTQRDAYAVFRVGLKLKRDAAQRVAEAVQSAVPVRDVEEFLRVLTLRFSVPADRLRTLRVPRTPLPTPVPR